MRQFPFCEKGERKTLALGLGAASSDTPELHYTVRHKDGGLFLNLFQKFQVFEERSKTLKNDCCQIIPPEKS